MDSHIGIQRFRGKDGEWVDVDLDLQKRSDGTVEPQGHAFGLTLPGKGRGQWMSVEDGLGKGRDVKLGFPMDLPEPTLEGSTATYEQVQPGVDMVVEALRTGFEQFFILEERPTAPVTWELPLQTKGLTAKPAKDGGVEFVDAKGTIVSRIPAAIAWDKTVHDTTGEHTNTSKVDLAVEQKSPGQGTLRITPDSAWLADESTQYPVTIDPTYAATTRTTTFDTYVHEGYTSGQSTSTELKLGNDGAGNRARSFLEFQLGTMKDKRIMSASLKLRATHSWSCNTRYWEAWKVGSDVSSSTVWSNQPAWETQYAASNQTKGYSSSCPDGEVSINIKSMVQMWADNNLTTNRLGLMAANEGDEYGWKKFASSETSYDPYISITYNRVPGTSAAPTVAPVASYNSALYTSDTTPAFTSKATDADGNTVKLTYEVHSSTTTSSTTLKASCTTAYVASGSNAACSSATALADNATYYVRAKANDSMQDGAWSSWTTFKMAAATPAGPTITCTGHPDGSWTDNPPASNVSCRISATGSGTNAPGWITYAIDGGATQRVQITQSTDPAVAKVDVTVSNKAGGHRISAWAESPSGKVSAEKKYAFGYGKVGIDSPATHPMPVTTGALAIEASGPPASTGTTATAELKWRLAASGDGETSGWNTAKSLTVTTDAATGGLKISGSWDTMSADRDAAAGIDLDSRVPTTIDLQVCVTYSAGDQCTWNSGPLQVLRVPHAFGEGFPVSDAGPGKVALWTGEFTTAATDVSVPGYVGDLSLSRTHSTYAGSPTASSGVFGPGWTASMNGPDAGVAGAELIDNTRVDGTLLLISPEGEPMVFAAASGWIRRTGANLATGTWNAVDDETGHLGAKASVSGTGTGTTFSFVDPDGVTTTFKATTAPSTTAAGVFAPSTVAEPGVASKVTYTHDSAGRVTRILAPIATGLTATDCPAAGDLAPGCRALDITYASSTTATSTSNGDITGQAKEVTLKIYDPGASAMTSIPVARYAYRSDKRLATFTDPRTGLTTSYGYDGSGRLSSLTEPGLTATTFEYAGTPAKLARVKRANPVSVGGTATLATVLYGIPTSGNGLPDLSANGVADWGQTQAPTYAAAAFGPDKAIGTLDPGAVAAADWSYADIQATDERGYTLNTAAHGAGVWQRTWTDYDSHGHPVRQLDAGDIAAIVAGDAVASQAGTITKYNTAANGPASTPAGSVVTDAYGPARWVTLTDGSRAFARPHTQTVYDEGSPNGGVNPDTGVGWRLPTSTKVGPVEPDTLAALEAATVTKTGYGASTDVAAWKLGLPRTTTQVVDGGTGDITRATVYNGEGRVTEVHQPKSAGADAGTRKSVYYTVAANSTHPECGSKPAWAGLECLTFYAGQASGQDLVRTHTSGYSTWLQPTTVAETANGATRTTTTNYDAAERVTKVRTATSGLTGSKAINGTETVYSTSTGLPVEQWALSAAGARTGTPIKTGYDSWGRATTYEPATGQVTTTTFDTFGRLASIADPKGARTFGYGNDVAGNPERRNLPTSLTVTGGPGGSLAFTGAYDADGILTTQKLPGGITQHTSVDLAGEPIGLEYRGQVTTVDEETGTSTVDSDAGWLGWSIDNDHLGRVRREWTPSGAAFSGGLQFGDAGAYDRAYTYDKANRLTKVEDRTAPAGAGFDELTGDPNGATCETRAYAFDKNSNRTSQSRTPGNANGTCVAPGSTGTTTRTWTYDVGDRLTGGYVYDAFGRATTIPAVDSPSGSANGNIALGYYDTDAIASIAQNGTTTTFGLDAAQRRETEASGPTGQPATSTITRNYADGSDNPAWVTTTDAAGTATTRFATSLGGDLGLTLHTPAGGSGVEGELTLADPRGDVVAVTPVPATGAAVGINSWTDHDEHGNPLGSGAPVDGAGTDGLGYGWLGAKQRATTDTGLTLMGARVYNRITSQFASTDPVYGGGATTYGYPVDPINQVDLDGRCWTVSSTYTTTRSWTYTKSSTKRSTARKVGSWGMDRLRGVTNYGAKAGGAAGAWGWGAGCAIGRFARGGVGCVAGGGALAGVAGGVGGIAGGVYGLFRGSKRWW